MTLWHVLTGEYPPQLGGVSHYSHLVASGLSIAGDEVHVWAPGREHFKPKDSAVAVHRLPDHFGPRALATLSHGLTGEGRLLVQYVPHAFGAKAMNIAFSAWLFSQRNRLPIDVMFHEVAFPIRRGQPLRHNFLGVVSLIMALMVVRAATRTFVAIPGWERTLRPLVGHPRLFMWLPVPSNIPVADDGEGAGSIRKRYSSTQNGLLIGHFGPYGDWISGALKASLLPILEQRSDVSLLLIGDRSEGFRSQLVEEHPRLVTRIHATGELDALEVSRHISASDLMVQPYPDGVSGRRGSAMAVLSHGRAMVTTSGHLTEPLWGQSGAVELIDANDAALFGAATSRLIDDEQKRTRLGRAAGALYAERFALAHTIAALREGS